MKTNGRSASSRLMKLSFLDLIPLALVPQTFNLLVLQFLGILRFFFLLVAFFFNIFLIFFFVFDIEMGDDSFDLSHVLLSEVFVAA